MRKYITKKTYKNHEDLRIYDDVELANEYKKKQKELWFDVVIIEMTLSSDWKYFDEILPF